MSKNWFAGSQDNMLTLSDMSTCGGLLFQYDSTIKLSPGSQNVDVERHVYMWRIAVSV